MIIGHSLTDRESIREIIKERGFKVYFIGIGGISMSSLAKMSAERGARVFGSDIRRSRATSELEKKGVRIKYVQNKSNIMEIMPDIAVYSLSIADDNPEYCVARALGIPIVSRAEYLGVIMEEYAFRVGISGSHGKSTTTAMLASVMACAGFNPSVLCGADIADGSGYVKGKEEYLIYEACEYGDSFLQFCPTVQLLLNLDLDHTDYFSDVEQLRKSFLKAANMAEGFAVVNADDENLKAIIPEITAKTVTYSLYDGADFRYELEEASSGIWKVILCGGGEKYKLNLGISGRFNAENAVGAAVAAIKLGAPAFAIEKAISEFRGIPRRLEFLGKKAHVDVFYDYAHHPKEIKAVSDALYGMGYKNVCALFSPHTYSRTKAMLSEFAKSLSGFGAVYVTEIYGARENAIVGVSSAALADAIKSKGCRAYALANEDSVTRILKENYDCLVLMGAGDLDIFKKQIEDL